ncbi:La- protein 4B [Podila epigama]|nr:La- protein 4B [Podila epigama]
MVVSHMDEERYVPISVIAQFKRVQAVTQDLEEIKAALRRSPVVIVDETGTKVKPAPAKPRTTLIIRDLPREEIVDLFVEAGCPAKEVTREVGNTWFVEFETADDALSMLSYIRGKRLREVPLAGRLKSNSVFTGGSRFSVPQASSKEHQTVSETCSSLTLADPPSDSIPQLAPFREPGAPTYRRFPLHPEDSFSSPAWNTPSTIHDSMPHNASQPLKASTLGSSSGMSSQPQLYHYQPSLNDAQFLAYNGLPYHYATSYLPFPYASANPRVSNTVCAGYDPSFVNRLEPGCSTNRRSVGIDQSHSNTVDVQAYEDASRYSACEHFDPGQVYSTPQAEYQSWYDACGTLSDHVGSMWAPSRALSEQSEHTSMSNKSTRHSSVKPTGPREGPPRSTKKKKNKKNQNKVFTETSVQKAADKLSTLTIKDQQSSKEGTSQGHTSNDSSINRDKSDDSGNANINDNRSTNLHQHQGSAINNVHGVTEQDNGSTSRLLGNENFPPLSSTCSLQTVPVPHVDRSEDVGQKRVQGVGKKTKWQPIKYEQHAPAQHQPKKYSSQKTERSVANIGVQNSQTLGQPKNQSKARHCDKVKHLPRAPGAVGSRDDPSTMSFSEREKLEFTPDDISMGQDSVTRCYPNPQSNYSIEAATVTDDAQEAIVTTVLASSPTGFNNDSDVVHSIESSSNQYATDPSISI